MRKFWSKQRILGAILLGIASQSIAALTIIPLSGARISCGGHGWCDLTGSVSNNGRVALQEVAVKYIPGKCGAISNTFSTYIASFNIDNGGNVDLDVRFTPKTDLPNFVCIELIGANGFLGSQSTVDVQHAQ